MSREKIKTLALAILNEDTFSDGRFTLRTFTDYDGDNIHSLERFKVAQYDKYEDYVEAAMPLDEFLDKLADRLAEE